MPYRVVHVGTGKTGTHALRGIIQHPELELVGLVVNAEEKVGRDAGDLCGVGPVGLKATRDLDAALALRPDAVCYMATAHARLKHTIEEFCKILASGSNIATTSVGALIHPGSVRPDVLARLEEACRTGSSSCFATGVDPGFFSDYLPVVLSGCSRRIDSIRIYELAVYESGQQSDEMAFDIEGFGGPIDSVPPLVEPAVLRNTGWGGVINLIAEQLGVKIEEITTHYTLIPAPESFPYQGRRIEKGTIAGMRFEIAGRIGGQTKIAVEHVTRSRPDLAPDLPRGLRGGDVYRIVIEGDPRLECEFDFKGSPGGDLEGAIVITAMRTVNAIPNICKARPGVLSTFDLPPTTGRGLMR